MDTRTDKGGPLMDRAWAPRQSLRTGAHASTGFGIVSTRDVGLKEAAGTTGGSGDAGPGTVFNDGHGSVLDNVHVQLVFWGRSWATIDFDLSVEDVVNAVITLLDSPYMSALQQYRVTGSGTLVGSMLVTDSDPPTLFNDADVSNKIAELVTSGSLPGPADDPQLLYCVILPAGVTSAADSSFVGEHFNFSLNGSSGQIAWVTTNDRTIGGLTSLTRIFSHELVESCTDPQFDSVQGAPGTCNQPGACEIGDVCKSTGVVGGVLVQSYWSQKDQRCIVPRGLVSGAPAGNATLIQGRFGRRGNFEMVVPADGIHGGLAHYVRLNDQAFVPWVGPNLFGQGVFVQGVSMIQSNFGSPGNLEVIARVGGELVAFVRDSGPAFHWFGPIPIRVNGQPIGNLSGDPCFIQSGFGTRGNFELVVPLASGGIAHYDRNNDDPSFPWFGPNIFAADVGVFTAVSLIQSNFGSPGNLEVVAIHNGQLLHFSRDSGPAFHWFGPEPVVANRRAVTGVTGSPSLIQGRFGIRGNFELVVPLLEGGLVHFDRNNDDASFPWFGPNPFGNDLGTFASVSLIQSNFGQPGNLELVANDEGQLMAFFRDSGPAFNWFGPYEITALF
jgi:hypothetical protein